MSQAINPRRKSGKRVALVGAAVVLGGIGYLLFSGLDDNIVYFLTPSELLAKGTEGQGRPVRLGGLVSPNSVTWDADRRDLRFKVTDGAKEVIVHSTGAPPQMFRDGIGVVLEGRYHSNGVFESSTVMVKHSNEYQPPKEGEKPEQVYKTLMKDGPK
jgi:cytochrome c-type biogenesis protein CcmE